MGDWWLKRDDVNDVARALGISSVPVLGVGTLFQGINLVRYGVKYLPEEVKSFQHQEDYNNWMKNLKPLQSAWGPFDAEGIVARPVVDLFNRKGERIITKIKTKDFR